MDWSRFLRGHNENEGGDQDRLELSDDEELKWSTIESGANSRQFRLRTRLVYLQENIDRRKRWLVLASALGGVSVLLVVVPRILEQAEERRMERAQAVRVIEARARVLSNAQSLGELGICANELKAELAFAGTKEDRNDYDLTSLRLGVKFATAAKLPCQENVSDDRQVDVELSGGDQVSVYRSMITGFHERDWCSQQNEIRQEQTRAIAVQPEKSGTIGRQLLIGGAFFDPAQTCAPMTP